MSLAESTLGKKTLQQGVRLLMHSPEKSLPLLFTWAEKIAHEENHKSAIRQMREAIKDKNSGWHRLTTRFVTATDPRIRERLAVNFFINATLLGVPKQKRMQRKLGAGVPWGILMDPTERCNLNCTGCWAGQYQGACDLDFDVMDRVCTEAEELGIYMILMSGGEPLMRKDDIVRLAEKHPSQVFHLFTNGTLVDEAFVQEMLRVRNIILAFSIEGLEESTDARRGRGTFQKLMHAMDLLRENHCPFGISTTYTRKNTHDLASDEFVDLMVRRGAYYAWYFTYIPIGKDVDLEYMATPEQRKYMYERIVHLREKKPLFMADFWNDGAATSGCIAGGRRYFHINAAGDVEPCAFVHYSTCNIKDVSLREALANPIFKAYQARQPFNQNMRRPCPLIDNPEELRKIVHESGAESTHVEQANIDDFARGMRQYAAEWGKVADEVWYGPKRQYG